MEKQLHVSAFFLGHHQVVHTSLNNAVYGVKAVTVMMRSHASYNITCCLLGLVVLGFGVWGRREDGTVLYLIWGLYITCSIFLPYSAFS